MEKIEKFVKQLKFDQFNTIIIGSGAAGLNCALHLIEEGIDPLDIAIITEKLGGGTSFNTGSDKQTYYKLSIIGDQLDSPFKMAEDLLSGGAMHGDIALIEANNSVREFFHLIHLGVEFPYDQFGGYVGYKTDNDLRQRATSVGPLTSQEMCKCLLKEIKSRGIRIFNNYYAVKILIEDGEENSQVMGIICIKLDDLSQDKDINNIFNCIRVFKVRNVIIATGGPAILYKNSVYPISQYGSTSLAIYAGCILQNLTESQFGLGSTKFRWNLSGSYQQVIPRYISIDKDHLEKEFLLQYFPSFTALSKAIFLKGYQWPFSSERIENNGSSIIDLAVYYESEILGKDVFLDFRTNPSGFNLDQLDPIVFEYLNKSNALAENPINRLKQLNEKAIIIFKDNGIDLYNEPLKMAVCNQHLNGGVAGDIWWESNIKNLFVIGEINGSHGIHRLGGAALNAGQVGGLRAAQKIGHIYYNTPSFTNESFLNVANIETKKIIEDLNQIFSNEDKVKSKKIKPSEILIQVQSRMSKYASIIRPLKGLEDELQNVQQQLKSLNKSILIKSTKDIIEYFRVKDALLTQLLILKSILNYHEVYGRSRGSYIILRDNLNNLYNEKYIYPPGNLKQFNYITSHLDLTKKVQTIQYIKGNLVIKWENVREIPSKMSWFESTWKEFINGKIYR